MSNRTKLKPKAAAPKIKLDLSYGDLPPGHPFSRPDKFDVCKTPFPLADGSVEEAYSAFLLQRIPAKLRGVWMDELWRVLVPGGKATVIVPYWTSARSVQDPFAEWPPLNEQSFLYFNRKFREDNKLPYGMACDFDFVYGYTLEQETTLRTDDTRPFWIKHYVNAINDLQVVLTKRL